MNTVVILAGHRREYDLYVYDLAMQARGNFNLKDSHWQISNVNYIFANHPDQLLGLKFDKVIRIGAWVDQALAMQRVVT